MNPKPAAGADLVIPALALAFAAYFLVSVAELAWEARANGVLIGVILIALACAQIGRIALQVKRSQATLRADPLWLPHESFVRRIALIAITVLFIGTLNWLGLTLGLALAMVAALWVSGVRRRAALVWIPLVVAASVYLLFIVLLQSGFPHGPIEKLLP